MALQSVYLKYDFDQSSDMFTTIILKRNIFIRLEA